MPESDPVQVEQRSVALADLKAGVPLLPGHVLLIVSDAQGSPKLVPEAAGETGSGPDTPAQEGAGAVRDGNAGRCEG